VCLTTVKLRSRLKGRS